MAPIRDARLEDAAAIAAVWRAGIEERTATFETWPPTLDAVEALISSGRPVLVAVEGGRMLGFAKLGPYDDRHDYYAEVGEATVYVDAAARGRGAGTGLLDALAREAERRGYHKLIGKIIVDNEASLAVVRACGFREVGVHLAHGRLDGDWKDVLVVERLLGRPPGRQTGRE